MTKSVRILHAALGPGWGMFTEGQVVPVEKMGHQILDHGQLVWYPWDMDRLVALGAVELTDAAPTTHEGMQFAPPPDVQPETPKAAEKKA